MDIIIKGAGEMASGVAVRLFRAGFTRLLMLETGQPLSVRRAVSFSEAVYDGAQCVEGVHAALITAPEEAEELWRQGRVAVAVDPQWQFIAAVQPDVVVDAILAKRNLGTHCDQAPRVLGLGPGFTAGVDVHAVIETQRGHNLGRVLLHGAAEPNTGVPGNIGGYTLQRVLRAPVSGVVHQRKAIGESVCAGDIVLHVGDFPVPSTIDGVVRGCIRDGIGVEPHVKLGDIDPRGIRDYCFTISEKARALGGAVLEEICRFSRTWGNAD